MSSSSRDPSSSSSSSSAPHSSLPLSDSVRLLHFFNTSSSSSLSGSSSSFLGRDPDVDVSGASSLAAACSYIGFQYSNSISVACDIVRSGASGASGSAQGGQQAGGGQHAKGQQSQTQTNVPGNPWKPPNDVFIIRRSDDANAVALVLRQQRRILRGGAELIKLVDTNTKRVRLAWQGERYVRGDVDINIFKCTLANKVLVVLVEFVHTSCHRWPEETITRVTHTASNAAPAGTPAVPQARRVIAPPQTLVAVANELEQSVNEIIAEKLPHAEVLAGGTWDPMDTPPFEQYVELGAQGSECLRLHTAVICASATGRVISGVRAGMNKSTPSAATPLVTPKQT